MRFTKKAMQDELRKFLTSYGQVVEMLYGATGRALSEQATVESSPLWVAVNDMYDYGIDGIPTPDLFPGGHIGDHHGVAERFLEAMDTPTARIFLAEHDVVPPRLALVTVRCAIARMVLDGGWRHTDYAAGTFGMLNGDWQRLTISEMALLADMDERSVRNAANPKLPDALKTEQVGQRSLVSPEEARRWLGRRKGFVPTKPAEVALNRKPEFDVLLTEEIIQQIEQKAVEMGVPTEKLLAAIVQMKLNEQKQKEAE